MFDDNTAFNTIQGLQAEIATLQDAKEAVRQRYQQFKMNFGVRERQDGSCVVDYDRFVEGLGPEGWIELRAIGDARWQVRGAPGEKPRMTVAAGEAVDAA